MTLEERSGLVLAFARTLFVNGQSTDQTLIAAERFGKALGLRVSILPRWGELLLHAQDGDGEITMTVEAVPVNVHMSRVSSAMQTLEDLCAGRVTPTAAGEAIATISRAPPAPAWLFTLAAAAGAAALAEIFGVQNLPAAVLIFGSAGAGAILRRGLSHLSANPFLQPFCAALLAGAIGALAVRFQLSSSLRLVALCPCMILVPGPPVLNGALDFVQARVHLGAARWIFAGLVIAAICSGLLPGLALFGVSLPVDPAPRAVPLWLDTIAAGVAVAAYSVFFSTPLQMLVWPVAVGMLAHGLRWWTIAVLGSTAPMGAMVACFIVGLILTPVARGRHMPFAAIGFASVVSMIPGVFLFRMASGLVQLAEGSHTTLELLSSTITDGLAAAAIIFGMSFGLLVPKLAIDRVEDRVPVSFGIRHASGKNEQPRD
jgi:uncharacterized membrane protein YjjP (DUF1212 family)